VINTGNDFGEVMKIEEILKEGISSVVYHFTGIEAARSILMNDEFKLSAVRDGEYEGSFQKGRKYFLSTARTRRGSYGVVERLPVYFELDGRKLSSRHGGISVDYWRGEGGRDEQEDRILSDSGVIPALSNIRSMSIYVGDRVEEKGGVLEQAELQRYIGVIRGVIRLYREAEGKVPVKMYSEWGSYLHGGRKVIGVGDLEGMIDDAEGRIKELGKKLVGMEVSKETEYRLEHYVGMGFPGSRVSFTGKVNDGRVEYRSGVVDGAVGRYEFKYVEGVGLKIGYVDSVVSYEFMCPPDKIKGVMLKIKGHEASGDMGVDLKGELLSVGCSVL